MNMPKTKAMRVYRNGDYVFLILLGDYDDTLDDDGNYEAAVEANLRAVVSSTQCFANNPTRADLLW